MFTVSVKRTKHQDLPTKISGPRRVKVGFPAGEADQDNINKAVWNEFGTKGHEVTDDGLGFGWGSIPERPFMRNSLRANSGKYRDAMAVSAKKILNGTASLTIVLSKLGIVAQGDIQAEITALTSPPNTAYTIAKKGSSKPLIDTGEMRGVVTYQVVK